MLKEDITDVRKERHKITQEDFTPECVLQELCPPDGDSLYTDFTTAFCDPAGGIGNILIYVLNKRLDLCQSDQDILSAVSTLYAVELMQDNVDEMKQRIVSACTDRYRELYSGNNHYLFCFVETVEQTVDHNVVCSDFFKWNFEDWCPKEEYRLESLFSADELDEIARFNQ